MNLWLPLAIGGHLLNACAFLIDKALLSTSFKRSGTYAALIGGLSCLALFALPWAPIPPAITWLPMAGFGSLFVLALWTFFEALRRGEATRVVPIIGSLIPVFTLLDTSILVGERLPVNGYIGFAFLVLATFILSSGPEKERLDRKTIAICVLSAFLFAASSALGKLAFLEGGFLSVFVWSRLFAAVIATLIGLFATGVKDELAKLVFVKNPQTAAEEGFKLGLMIFGQLAGATGFLLVQLAISQGSAAIVNAMQSVQYAILVLVAWFGGEKLAQILHEHRTTRAFIAKGSAILLVAFGLYLITHAG
jgi:drug/metabolite transporter (DMT)-like permease